MQTMLPLFAASATDLMALSVIMSGLAFVIVLLAAFVYVFNFAASGISLVVDTVLAAISFVVGKSWKASTLQMVALYSCVGGGSASAIAAAEIFGNKEAGASGLALSLIGALIGAMSLSGSVIAWAKISGSNRRRLRYWDRQAFNLAVTVAALSVMGYIGLMAQGGADRLIVTSGLVYGLLGCGLLLGALITLPLDRGHMPATIYLCNAFTGLAIALEGVALLNSMLIIAGILVCVARMVLALTMVKLTVIEA